MTADDKPARFVKPVITGWLVRSIWTADDVVSSNAPHDDDRALRASDRWERTLTPRIATRVLRDGTMTRVTVRPSDTRAIGARLFCIGLLVALALVLLGFVTGQHGMVDFLALISAGAALLVGLPIWCTGWMTSRRTRRQP